jgi:hypothetical protein
MPSTERRTPAKRSLPPAGMPGVGGRRRALPPAAASGSPGGERRRVPWTGWKSQLRDRNGRWTGEQLEGVGGREERSSPFGGEGETGAERVDDLTESIDALTEEVKKLTDAMKDSSKTTASGPDQAGKLDNATGDVRGARQLDSTPAKESRDVSADSDMDFARGLGGVLKALPAILEALA